MPRGVLGDDRGGDDVVGREGLEVGEEEHGDDVLCGGRVFGVDGEGADALHADCGEAWGAGSGGEGGGILPEETERISEVGPKVGRVADDEVLDAL